MDVFEAQLIALAESMAEQLIGHLVAQLESKLGLTTTASSQSIGIKNPQSVE